jgi:hypothetical protein
VQVELIIWEGAAGATATAFLNERYPAYDTTCTRQTWYAAFDFSGTVQSSDLGPYIKWDKCDAQQYPASDMTAALIDDITYVGGAECVVPINGEIHTVEFTVLYRGPYPGNEGDIYL